MLLLLFLSVLVYSVYLLLRRSHNYWETRNVPYAKPLPLVGNMGANLFRIRTVTELIQSIYANFPNSRYVGIYQFYAPTLLVKDPELIKQITVKEFDTFRDRRTFASEDIDPLWAKNISAMKGDAKWHDMRSTLSPSFTTSKMKLMFELMRHCAEQLTDYFLKQGGTVTVEMKDTFSRFSNDVIGTTAFGITCNSLENRENEFYLMGKDLSNFSGIRALRFFLYTISPTLMKLLNIGIFPKKTSKFFKSVIQDALKIREEKGIVRPDMIHLLMEARKGRLKNDDTNLVEDSGFAVVQEYEAVTPLKKTKTTLTEDDIIAQAIIFFLGGFDTVSTMMTFATYELAINPDIQEKLRTEVDDTMKKCHGQLTYEGLVGMKYLDMVISETLRKWPPAPFTDRMSVRPYTIKPNSSEESSITLESGTNIWIPIDAIHKDPKYYSNPEKFDPERFNERNKQNIKPFTYMPFGSGPRNCIASRFALLEGKLAIAEIISKFDIIPVPKTCIPIQMDATSFTPKVKNGLWLGLKPR